MWHPPWEHEGRGAAEDGERLVARPRVVRDDAVQAEAERDRKDGNAPVFKREMLVGSSLKRRE